MKKLCILFMFLLLLLISCNNNSNKYSIEINNIKIEESSEDDLITPGKLYDNWIKLDNYHSISIKNDKVKVNNIGYYNLDNKNDEYYNFTNINYTLTKNNNVNEIKIDDNYEIIDRQIMVINFEINENNTIHKFRIGVVNRENP